MSLSPPVAGATADMVLIAHRLCSPSFCSWTSGRTTTCEAAVGERRQLFLADALVDADGVAAAPGALLVQGSRILAAGRPEEIGPAAGAETRRLRGVLIPALVNAHAHLDLTAIGPRPFEGRFTDWIAMIRRERMHVTDADVAAAVRKGVELSRRGGTALIGDIAGNGSSVPIAVQRELGLAGVSFLEVFGMGDRQDAAIERLRGAIAGIPQYACNVRLGIQPHAPYSCGPRVYEAAARIGLPIATHLAETQDEIEFTTTATGPFAAFLRSLGVWNDAIKPAGTHPVDAVLSAVDNLSIVAAHLNYIDDRHLPALAAANVRAVYCPRASAYFGHTGHRYRDMLNAGINVALGTDSIVCLDSPAQLSVLDEMRVLLQRDGTNSRTLLRMATTNGARSLGFEESLCTFAPGASAGVLALALPDSASPAQGAMELLTRAIAHQQSPQWIVGPITGEEFDHHGPRSAV